MMYKQAAEPWVLQGLPEKTRVAPWGGGQTSSQLFPPSTILFIFQPSGRTLFTFPKLQIENAVELPRWPNGPPVAKPSQSRPSPGGQRLGKPPPGPSRYSCRSCRLRSARLSAFRLRRSRRWSSRVSSTSALNARPAWLAGAVNVSCGASSCAVLTAAGAARRAAAWTGPSPRGRDTAGVRGRCPPHPWSFCRPPQETFSAFFFRGNHFQNKPIYPKTDKIPGWVAIFQPKY